MTVLMPQLSSLKVLINPEKMWYMTNSNTPVDVKIFINWKNYLSWLLSEYAASYVKHPDILTTEPYVLEPRVNCYCNTR